MRYAFVTLLCLLPAIARADMTVKDSTGATVTVDTTTNGSVHTTHHVVTDGAGTQQGTASAPLRTDPTGSTAQPVTDNGSTLSIDDGGSTVTVDGTVSVTGVATQTTLASALTELQSILAKLNAALGALGQTTMAGSAPVVIASNQTAVPVTDNSGTLSVDDGASSLTVDGTVTANLAAGTNNIGDVDVLSISAGDNNIGNVDLASAIPAGSNAIGTVTAVGTAANGAAVSGNPLRIAGSDSSNTVDVLVDSTGRLIVQGASAHDASATARNPMVVAGSASAAAPSDVSSDNDVVRLWALRNGAQVTQLSAAGALIGGDATNGVDADVTRVIPGTSASHLGKAEDAAAASGDTMVSAAAVRDDSVSADAADGDYVPLKTDSSNRLYTTSTVTSVATPSTVYPGQTTVTTAGTQVTLGASQAITTGCLVKAKEANTGFIYVGISTVDSTTGYTLDNGVDQFFPIDNRTTLWIDSSVNAEGVSYYCY